MNAPNDDLRDLLAPLRAVEPNADASARNLEAALAAAEAAPWWRRKVEAPLPVVLAAAAVLVAIGFGLRQSSPPDAPTTNPPVVAPGPSHADVMVARVSDSVYQSSRYLPGVGPVDRVTRYPASP